MIGTDLTTMAAEDGQRLEADGVHYDHLTLSKTNVEETVKYSDEIPTSPAVVE